MKKLNKAILILFLCQYGFAGGLYSTPQIDMYSPNGDTYLRGESAQTETKGLFSSSGGEVWTKNVRVFDLKTGESWALLARDLPSTVTVLTVEYPPDKESSSSRFGAFRNLDFKTGVGAVLIIATRDRNSGEETVFAADANGRNIREVARIPDGDAWHIDQKHMKLRVFTSRNGALTMLEHKLTGAAN